MCIRDRLYTARYHVLNRFAPLFTYKVLKRKSYYIMKYSCFAPLFTYKVLKHNSEIDRLLSALHLYLLTRFSNTSAVYLFSNWLCTFIYLQGSQTAKCFPLRRKELCTFIYLQGSQTRWALGLPYSALCTFIYLQGSQTSNLFSRSSPNP